MHQVTLNDNALPNIEVKIHLSGVHLNIKDGRTHYNEHKVLANKMGDHLACTF